MASLTYWQAFIRGGIAGAVVACLITVTALYLL
jgi:hypothetical protein